MRGFLQGRPDQPFTRPDKLTQVEVCDFSGLLPTPACPRTRREWFIAGTQPTQTDSMYQQAWVDALTNLPANDATPFERRKSIIALNLPIEAQSWAHEQGLPLLVDYSLDSGSVLPSLQEHTCPGTPHCTSCGARCQGAPDSIVLLAPHPNTTYRLDPNFDSAAQQLQIEVAADQGLSQVTIWMDENLLMTLASPPYQAWWTLAAGEHHFWAQGVSA